jgi:UDP-N-acetylmuramate dehydrogenase
MTTLGVGGSADYFGEARTEEELRVCIEWARQEGVPLTILGGGSNVLIPDEGIRGLVLRPRFSEITCREEGAYTLVTAGAGVVFDEFVGMLVTQGLWGLENLSGIPGTVGGVPIQNVGAYGVEAKDVIVSVDAYDPLTGAIRTVSHDECAFAYRDSYFKQGGKHLIITSVTFRVSEEPLPKLGYKDLAARFDREEAPTLAEIRHAVIEIRSRKFPDWRTTGTAGSFFKNPIIPMEHYERLRTTYPELPGFPTEDCHVKVSLGWILDHVCGLRGYTEGAVGLYREQALVLVCERTASTEEVIAFGDMVIARVFEATAIHVEREVTMLAHHA